MTSQFQSAAVSTDGAGLSGSPTPGGTGSKALSSVRHDGVDVSHGPILYLESVTVSFDGFKALNELSLTVDDGELRCVIGPNGAGKTTMMDVITGKTRPDTGRVSFGQSIDLTKMTEDRIVQAGIGRKFQRPTVFETLTVFENMELAVKSDRRPRATLRAALDSTQVDQIDSVLKRVNLRQAHRRIAGSLSHGQKQWLEIGMLLAQEPKLILLDEPVAGMTDAETDQTADLCLSLEGRHSLVVVEHDMAFVEKIARRVTVLHEGSVLTEGSLAQVRADERVVSVYLGR